jgi:lysozyme family protein
MRWGVRSAKPSTVTKTGRTKFEKKAHRLSDAELQKRIKRLEMEKKYNDLNKADITNGKKFASDTTSQIGKTVITSLATGAIMLGISAMLNKKNPALAKGITKVDAGELFPKKT